MLNLTIIHGRLTLDPVMRQTQSGVPVCDFTVAVDRDFARNGEEKQTDFFDCVAWRVAGENIAKFFSKGKEIVVIGKMQSKKRQSEDGNNRTYWELQVDSFNFCGPKEGDEAATSANYSTTSSKFTELGENIDSLPF